MQWHVTASLDLDCRHCTIQRRFVSQLVVLAKFMACYLAKLSFVDEYVLLHGLPLGSASQLIVRVYN